MKTKQDLIDAIGKISDWNETDRKADEGMGREATYRARDDHIARIIRAVLTLQFPPK